MIPGVGSGWCRSYGGEGRRTGGAAGSSGDVGWVWEAELICVKGLRLSAQMSGSGEEGRNGCNLGIPAAG